MYLFGLLGCLLSREAIQVNKEEGDWGMVVVGYLCVALGPIKTEVTVSHRQNNKY